MRSLIAAIATLAGGAFAAAPATACVTGAFDIFSPYWTEPPPKLAANEVVLEIEYLRSESTPATPAIYRDVPGALRFRVVRVVTGQFAASQVLILNPICGQVSGAYEFERNFVVGETGKDAAGVPVLNARLRGPCWTTNPGGPDASLICEAGGPAARPRS